MLPFFQISHMIFGAKPLKRLSSRQSDLSFIHLIYKSEILLMGASYLPFEEKLEKFKECFQFNFDIAIFLWLNEKRFMLLHDATCNSTRVFLKGSFSVFQMQDKIGLQREINVFLTFFSFQLSTCFRTHSLIANAITSATRSFEWTGDSKNISLFVLCAHFDGDFAIKGHCFVDI